MKIQLSTGTGFVKKIILWQPNTPLTFSNCLQTLSVEKNLPISSSRCVGLLFICWHWKQWQVLKSWHSGQKCVKTWNLIISSFGKLSNKRFSFYKKFLSSLHKAWTSLDWGFLPDPGILEQIIFIQEKCLRADIDLC